MSFRREGPVVFGGPNGGDGGKGGDVWLIADHNVSSLLAFRDHPHRRADSGVHGKGKDLHGRRGESLDIKVPEGTVVKDLYTGEVIAELYQHGDKFLAAAGGRGGRGNAKFLSNRRRAPTLRRAGRARRGALAQARAAADGRRRSGRISQRRQEHVDQRDLGRQAEDRRLSVHDARAQPRRRVARRRHQLRGRRHPGSDRGGQRGAWPRPSVPSPHRARPCAVPVDRSGLARRSRPQPSRSGSCCTNWRSTGPTCSIARGSWSAPRPTSCRRRISSRSVGSQPVISAVTGQGVRELVGPDGDAGARGARVGTRAGRPRRHSPRADRRHRRARRRPRVPTRRSRGRADRRAQRRHHSRGTRLHRLHASSRWAC